MTLAEGPNGEVLEPTHPVFGKEEAHTCAGCHVRRTLSGPGWGSTTDKLAIDTDMGFRMIAYGGRIAERTQNLGVRRPDYRAEMAPYLRDSAILRTTSQEWPNADEEPSLYDYFGDPSDIEPGCGPYRGCVCDDHQEFAQCLIDIVDIGQLSSVLSRPFKLEVQNLAEASLKHAKACTEAAEGEAIAARACDMLRCVAQAAHDGFELELDYAGVVRNDPTFGCQMFTPLLETPEFF